MLSWVLNHPESSVLFLTSLFCLWQSWWFKRDFFSPANIYCFTQTITLGIAYLNLNPAMTPLQPKTWMFWTGGLFSFMTGCFLVSLLLKRNGSQFQTIALQPVEIYNWNLHVLLSFIPFCLFMVGIWGLVQKTGNLLVFADDPAMWMTKDVDYGYYAALFSSGPLLTLLYGVASFKKYNPFFGARLVARIMVLLSITLNLLAYPNRTALFFNLGALIILFNYLRRRISPILIMISLLLAIFAFVGISIIRDQYGSGSVEGLAIETAMDLPYKYVANNYWNLDYVINAPTDIEYHPHTYGIDFFYGIFDYLRIGGSFRNSYGWDGPFNERVMKVSGLNTTHYLWDVYKDLYMPGVFIFPFLCGFGLTYLYRKLYKPFTPKVILFYTFLIYLVGWWWFTAGYKQGIYWVWSLFLFIIPTVCQSRKSLPAEASLSKELDGKHTGEDQVSA